MKNSSITILTIILGLIIIAAASLVALKGNKNGPVVLAPTTMPSAQTSPVSLPAGEARPSVRPTATPALVTPSSVANVPITDNGIIPATLTVKVGTKVNFINNGQALHWIASDPHPVHTGLLGLDSKKGLSTGESYTFTFEKAGTFGIHDHLNTKIKGTIIVQ